ncbi:hypothetical protein GCM10011494_34630 [Novosphingobium endophyticum]|uniref:Uncharacterized protein n=1 Tax=Novosphingobium endophyticum TaxID=1955250 RepID=A0A916X6Z4_9SPHN|nr:hypothetical protein GCM10011494_34630 [Novosphingobium endophyticum]
MDDGPHVHDVRAGGNEWRPGAPKLEPLDDDIVIVLAHVDGRLLRRLDSEAPDVEIVRVGKVQEIIDENVIPIIRVEIAVDGVIPIAILEGAEIGDFGRIRQR